MDTTKELIEAIKTKKASKQMATETNAKSFSLISDRIIKLCNYRIQQEEYSSRLYLAMSKWLENKGYLGAAKLWKKYSEEELSHAEIIYGFLLDLGIQPEVPELSKPKQDYTGLVEIVNASYEHEVDIYKQCSELAKASYEENQLMLYPIALKLTQEQSEELSKLQNWIDMFASFGTEQITLLHIDEKMGNMV